MDGDVWSLDPAEMTRMPESAKTARGAPPLTAAAVRHEEALPAHDVRALMDGGSRALMVLDGTVYTLRITRAGKLILTK